MAPRETTRSWGTNKNAWRNRATPSMPSSTFRLLDQCALSPTDLINASCKFDRFAVCAHIRHVCKVDRSFLVDTMAWSGVCCVALRCVALVEIEVRCVCAQRKHATS